MLRLIVLSRSHLRLASCAARLAIITVALGLARTPAFGQTNSSEPWHGYVTAENLSVRCGRAHEYYEIGKLEEGDIVRVRDVNQFGWATIAAPPGTHGFVRAIDVDVTNDQSSATTVSRTPVYYINQDDPVESWKPARVEAGSKLNVIESRDSPRGLYFRVAMPESVDAYVPAEFIRPATDAEVEAWRDRLANAEAESAPADSAAVPDNEPAVDTEPTIEEEAPPAEPEPEADEQSQPVVEADRPVEPTQQPAPMEQAPIEEESPAEDDGVGEVETNEQPVIEDEAGFEETIETETPLFELEPVDEAETDAEPLDELTEVGESAPELPELSLEELESELERVTEGELLEAELEPLMSGYATIAEAESTPDSHRRLARARLLWLELKLDSQRVERQLQESLSRASRTPEEIASEAQIEDMAALYDVVGRLTPSSVYDGVRRPLLYRIVDSSSGRTLAYVQPVGDTGIETMLSEIVGVSGATVELEDLGIKVIRPRRARSLGAPASPEG